MSEHKFWPAVLCCKSVVFGGATDSGCAKGEPGYAVFRRIIFCGTDTLGFDLATIKIIASLVSGTAAGSVRIYDETNSQTIVEITGITALSPTIYNSGALNNLSTGEAIWAIEIQGGVGSTLVIELLSFCCP